MKDMFTIMKFTIKDMLHRKSFIVSTIITLLLIVVGTNIPNIVNLFSNDIDGGKILVVDKDNIFEDTLYSKLGEIGYNVIIINEDLDNDTLQNKFLELDIDEGFVINKLDNNIDVVYYTNNVALVETVPEGFINFLTDLYFDISLNKLNLSSEQLSTLKPNFNFNLAQIGEKEASGNILVSMFISIALFYAIYFCAYQVSGSITIEKTSKIIETLVTSTSPKNIIYGKTLGIGILGLGQLVLNMVALLLSVNLFMDKTLVSNFVNLSMITPYLLIITLVYFLLGYFTYAFLYALTGSTVSKPEDVQAANGPIGFIAVFGFYLAYFTMMNPTSDFNTIASLIPFSSPFCMPLRVLMGVADIKMVLLSCLILVLTIILIAKIAIKVYSNAIINYGTKLSFKDLIKLYKQK